MARNGKPGLDPPQLILSIIAGGALVAFTVAALTNPNIDVPDGLRFLLAPIIVAVMGRGLLKSPETIAKTFEKLMNQAEETPAKPRKARPREEDEEDGPGTNP